MVVYVVNTLHTMVQIYQETNELKGTLVSKIKQ